MKKLVLSLLLVVLMVNAIGQAPASPGYSRDYYLKKSKSQKIVAFLLLGGGIGTAVAGGALSGTYAEDAGKWMAIGGGVLAVSSIPLFISSEKNKRKADAMIALGTQPVYWPRQNGFSFNRQPAILFRVSL